MPSNSFPTIGNVQNPFTVQVAGYTGVFTANFDSGAGSFKIYDSTDSTNYIQFAANSNPISSLISINVNGTSYGFGSSGNFTIGSYFSFTGGQFNSQNTGSVMFDNTHTFYCADGNIAFANQSGSIVQFSAKAQFGGGTASADGSNGLTGTLTAASLVGKTLTFKNGLITAFA
jgi:hypothetical protein